MVVTVLLVLLLLLIPAGVLVRSFFNVVTTLSDDGPGSLRWDIDLANPGSTITFDANLRGTILLTNGGLIIEKNLTIRGPGAGILSISGGISVERATVTISGLTFKGGISNEGTLTLTNSTVSGNSGGGIFNGTNKTLTLINSTVSGNTATGPNSYGGGIWNSGTLTLTNSTVSGNMTSRDGGGIYENGGTLTTSTVSGNTANSGGGSIRNGSTLTLTNSTVSGNSAEFGGGGIAISAQNSTRATENGSPTPIQVMLLYCTVYGNTASAGGGIWVGNLNKQDQVTMGASIVAGNSAHTGPDIAGRLTTLGYNLVGDRSGATFLGSPKMQSTDKVGASSTALGIDPLLRDNGGSAKPHTWTHALLPGSPAIDLIPPDVCMMFKVFNDQRGVRRPLGKGCDGGAYEYSP
jgi:hypothetical protein